MEEGENTDAGDETDFFCFAAFMPSVFDEGVPLVKWRFLRPPGSVLELCRADRVMKGDFSIMESVTQIQKRSQVRLGGLLSVLMGVFVFFGGTGGAFAEADMSKKSESESSLRSEKDAAEMKPRSLKDEIVGVKPQLGVVVFNEAINGVTQDATSRAAYGVSLDLNLARWRSDERREWFVGPSTGFVFSHIGDIGSNFFGTGDVDGGGNLLIVPLNLKVGYNISDTMRTSIRAGANLVSRSRGSLLNLGEQGRTTASDTTFYPNVGIDFEFGRKVVFMVRPDLTITPGDEIFTGTFAISIPMS